MGTVEIDDIANRCLSMAPQHPLTVEEAIHAAEQDERFALEKRRG